ncbi:hypothetical protein GUJ93_ZPchr0003g18594 [Zizania palustris]|uniref:Uncharacterized protein n=1 Tax=Zizania palustris TaxID=103762 RepID=A0A8J5VIK4_ZIZPA|nr:hypothetical protein GUJ93_ZPchr0003g18594 [Zizania palustris]
MTAGVSSLKNSIKHRCVMIPEQPEEVPTRAGERTVEEEVHQSFLGVVLAERTSKIIPSRKNVTSSEDIPSIQPIRAKQPEEDFNLVGTLGVPNRTNNWVCHRMLEVVAVKLLG